VRDRHVLQGHALVHHYGARACVDDHLGGLLDRGDLKALDVPDEGDTHRRVVGGTHLDATTVERLCSARVGNIDRIHDAARGAKVGVVELEYDRTALPHRCRNCPLHDCPTGYAPGGKVVDYL